jgi:hypothetical protein
MCPHHKMAGAYCVTLLCHSILTSSSVSVHYLSNGCTHSTQIWHMDISLKNTGKVWLCDRVMPLDEIFCFRSLSPQHSNLTYGFAKEWAGQVQIWSWFDDFWQSYAPFTLKMKWNFQFPFIISPRVLHIPLKFDIWICQRNAQVKLEFGHSSLIFGRVMPL